MKEINLLWADPDHLDIWESHILALEECYGFKVACLSNVDEKKMLNECRDKDAVIIHCGTLHPMAGIKELLMKIRTDYPNIKIGLETNVSHPHLEGLTDFYITKPLSIDELQEDLRKVIK